MISFLMNIQINEFLKPLTSTFINVGIMVIFIISSIILSNIIDELSKKISIKLLSDWLHEIKSDLRRGGIFQSVNYFICWKITEHLKIDRSLIVASLTTGFIIIGGSLMVSLLSIGSEYLNNYVRSNDKMTPKDKSITLTIIPVTTSVARYLNIAICSVLILSAWGINIAPILTGSAIVLAVFGFAGQAILQDLMGFVSVIIDRPFYVGSDVMFILENNRERGIISQITLRNIVIVTDEKYEFYIPNRDAKNFRVYKK